jgi:hypothetical protein
MAAAERDWPGEEGRPSRLRGITAVRRYRRLRRCWPGAQGLLVGPVVQHERDEVGIAGLHRFEEIGAGHDADDRIGPAEFVGPPGLLGLRGNRSLLLTRIPWGSVRLGI